MDKRIKLRFLCVFAVAALLFTTGFVTALPQTGRTDGVNRVVAADEESAESADGQKDSGSEGAVTCVDDLAGSRIGVQLGTTGDIFASDYEDDGVTEVVRYNKGADAVAALKQGKIDCVLIDEQPAKAYVAKNPDLKILDEEFAIEDYAICVAKGNSGLTDKLNGAIDELEADGTLASIISYYIEGEGGPYESEVTEYPNGELVMATNAEFPPYESFENGTIVGIDVDIAHAIADSLGMKLTVSNMEFDSVIIAVQSGKADFGMAGMTVTEDRLKNIDFTESYTTSKQVIIVQDPDAAAGGSQGLIENIKSTFIDGDRWQYIPKGLLNTVIITLFAGIIGIIIGFIIAIIRVAYDMSDSRGAGIWLANAIVKLYLTIFRGTPMMVQLLIMYYVIFASVNVNAVLVAVLAFGLNSGAYVAEAVRAGIISIPVGQFEAGRSLGFTYTQTMRYVIMPQAVRNALPAMFNEFIALLKESSIVGYIGLIDLTKAGDIIRSGTYSAFLPLITVGLIYLVIVMIMTAGVSRLERRLKKDAR